MESNLIAPCGINCNACKAHLLNKNKCPGCRIKDETKPVTRVKCKIKNCPKLKDYCFECAKFPCENLEKLDKRYRVKYHVNVIENLRTIQKEGIEKFLKAEKTKWECQNCGGLICMHTGKCVKCMEENR